MAFFGSIYKIEFPNGKHYIGITTTSLEQRAKEHETLFISIFLQRKREREKERERVKKRGRYNIYNNDGIKCIASDDL